MGTMHRPHVDRWHTCSTPCHLSAPQVVHGRYDILAAPKHAEALARKMCCRLVMVEGAHFITRECGTELNSLLRAIIFPAQVPIKFNKC